jgi:UDP-N-acetylglucosamine 2-epimerase (non-hydrolysing)
MKRKIAIIAGTRPEAIKLVPVYFALRENSGFDVRLISTGQHQEMMEPVFNFFNISPDYEFNLMQGSQSLADISAKIITSCSALFSQERFDLVIVQGDTSSAFLGALSAYYHRIPVAHIEAGLRTDDIYAPFPEEVNRRCISTFASIHFAPTPFAAAQLERENRANVIVSGNTVIDSVLDCVKRVNLSAEHYKFKLGRWIDESKEIIGITAHRREQFGIGLSNICDALAEIAGKHLDKQFIFPVHMNPEVSRIVHKKLADSPNLVLLPPLPYDEWIFILKQCIAVLTDSGGIQEEALALNIPVFVMRDKTERPEGVESGGAVLCGTERQQIIDTVEFYLNSEQKMQHMRMAVNPYGDGTSSVKIATFIEQYFLNQP